VDGTAATDNGVGLAVSLRRTASTSGASLLLLLLARTLTHAVAILARTFALATAVVGQTPVHVVVVVAQYTPVIVQVFGVIGDAKRRDTRTVPAHTYALCQMISEYTCGHTALAIWTVTLLRFLHRMLTKYI